MPGFLDDYEPVEDRIRQFYSDQKWGCIRTYFRAAPEGEYIFLAEVYRGPDEEHPSATGWAHESVAQLPANMKASALEVCETSAIGRALANLGYAPKGKRPSREEMSARQAPPPSPASDREQSSPSPSRAEAAPISSGGEGPHDGEGEDPNLLTIAESRNSLWKQLDQFAGSRAKAINAVNRVCKTSWTRGNVDYIPAEDLELTLRALLREAG